MEEETLSKKQISNDKSIGSESISSSGLLIQDIDICFGEEEKIEVPSTIRRVTTNNALGQLQSST